jgi:hypothetical protein
VPGAEAEAVPGLGCCRTGLPQCVCAVTLCPALHGSTRSGLTCMPVTSPLLLLQPMPHHNSEHNTSCTTPADVPPRLLPPPSHSAPAAPPPQVPPPAAFISRMMAATTPAIPASSPDTITRMLLIYVVAGVEPSQDWMLAALPVLEASLEEASPAALSLVLLLLQELEWVPSWMLRYSQVAVARSRELSPRQLARLVLPAVMQQATRLQALGSLNLEDWGDMQVLFGRVYGKLLARWDECTKGDLLVALAAAEEGLVALSDDMLERLRRAMESAPDEEVEEEGVEDAGSVGAGEGARALPDLLATVSRQWMLESTGGVTGGSGTVMSSSEE